MNQGITESNLEQAKSTGIVRKVDDLGRVVLPKISKCLDIIGYPNKYKIQTFSRNAT